MHGFATDQMKKQVRESGHSLVSQTLNKFVEIVNNAIFPWFGKYSDFFHKNLLTFNGFIVSK